MGWRCRDAWIAAAVRCAPPDNKPTPHEIANCQDHLRDELAAIPTIRVYVALGRIAFDACRRLIEDAYGRARAETGVRAWRRVRAFGRARHSSRRTIRAARTRIPAG